MRWIGTLVSFGILPAYWLKGLTGDMHADEPQASMMQATSFIFVTHTADVLVTHMVMVGNIALGLGRKPVMSAMQCSRFRYISNPNITTSSKCTYSLHFLWFGISRL